MRSPILVAIIDPDGADRDAAETLQREASRVEGELWLVLVGPRATKTLKPRWARMFGLEETRVVLPKTEQAPDPEVDPDPVARYLRDTFTRIARSRMVHLLARPDRPRTLAMLAELAAVLQTFRLQLEGIGVVPRYIDATRRLAETLPKAAATAEMLGRSPGIERVREQIARYATLPWPVLVLGETGTGKELVANALHAASRRTGNFIAVNAARLIDDRAAESELFGHLKGAFTGADTPRDGRIKEAKDGTFFLDEFPNLAPNLQGRLLRALNKADEGRLSVYPMGGTDSDEKPVPVRFVAAAQGDPRAENTLAGTHPIRDDLYWRLATLVIRIPPLRDRGDDVQLLADDVVSRLPSLAGAPLALDDEARRFLQHHPWHGNVRELVTVIRRAWVLLESNETTISRAHLQESVDARRREALRLEIPCVLKRELGRLGRQAIEDALQQAKTDTEAGALLGIKDIRRKLDTYTNWERSDGND